jgi:uncharacterized phage-associated protein
MELYNSKYTATHVANYFLNKENHELTILKLIKIVFLSFGWGTAFFNKRIFWNKIEAWRYGPVIPSLYHSLKHHKNNIITEEIEELIFDSEDINTIKPKVKDKRLEKLLEAIWNKYGKYDISQLITVTHKRGTPWFETYDGSYYNEIDIDLIADYYKSFLRK